MEQMEHALNVMDLVKLVLTKTLVQPVRKEKFMYQLPKNVQKNVQKQCTKSMELVMNVHQIVRSVKMIKFVLSVQSLLIFITINV